MGPNVPRDIADWPDQWLVDLLADIDSQPDPVRRQLTGLREQTHGLLSCRETE
jgi:hypothetical protein